MIQKVESRDRPNVILWKLKPNWKSAETDSKYLTRLSVESERYVTRRKILKLCRETTMQ